MQRYRVPQCDSGYVQEIQRRFHQFTLPINSELIPCSSKMQIRLNLRARGHLTGVSYLELNTLEFNHICPSNTFRNLAQAHRRT